MFFLDVPGGFNMFQSDVYVLFSCQSLPMMIHQQKLEKQSHFEGRCMFQARSSLISLLEAFHSRWADF